MAASTNNIILLLCSEKCGEEERGRVESLAHHSSLFLLYHFQSFFKSRGQKEVEAVGTAAYSPSAQVPRGLDQSKIHVSM